MTQNIILSNGAEVAIPLVTDDSLACFETFRVDAGSLPKPPGPLGHASLMGKTACMILAADYRKMSIGPYREIVVMSPVRYRGNGKPRVKAGFFVHNIAVTSEISMLTGRQVWGFPKYLADINIRQSSWNIRATMESEELNFILSMPGWGLPVPATAPLPIFTVKDGKLLQSFIKMKGTMFISPPASARITMTGEASAVSFLGKSRRAIAAGFMKVKKATLDGAVFEESL